LCGSRKYPYPPHGWSLEIPKGWGSQRPKFSKESYEAKLEFLEGGGGGFKVKTIYGGGMDIFWNHTLLSIYIYIR